MLNGISFVERRIGDDLSDIELVGIDDILDKEESTNNIFDQEVTCSQLLCGFVFHGEETGYILLVCHSILYQGLFNYGGIVLTTQLLGSNLTTTYVTTWLFRTRYEIFALISMFDYKLSTNYLTYALLYQI